MPPCTTQIRTTTNLKTKTTQNCQKIKLYGSPTTKELKKKHSFRPVGGAEMGNQGGKDSWQSSGWRTRWSHICVQINQEKQLGNKTDCITQGSSKGKISLKTSDCKNLWGLLWQKKLPVSQESSLERPTGSWNIHKPTHIDSTRRAQHACG